MQREDISRVCALDAFLCAAAGKTRRNHENGTTPAATRHLPCSEVCVRCIVRRDRISTPPRPRGQRYGQRDDRSKRLSPPPPQPRRRIYCGNQRLAYLMPLAIGPARSARLLRQGERPRLYRSVTARSAVNDRAVSRRDATRTILYCVLWHVGLCGRVDGCTFRGRQPSLD